MVVIVIIIIVIAIMIVIMINIIAFGLRLSGDPFSRSSRGPSAAVSPREG